MEDARNTRNSIRLKHDDAKIEDRKLKSLLDRTKVSRQNLDNDISKLKQILTSCKILENFADAKPSVETIDVFATAAEDAAKKAKECAKKAKANLQLLPDIKKAMADCKFEKALQLADQLNQVDPSNAWLASNYSTLKEQAKAQNEARSYLVPAQFAIQAKNLDGALTSLKVH